MHLVVQTRTLVPVHAHTHTHLRAECLLLNKLHFGLRKTRCTCKMVRFWCATVDQGHSRHWYERMGVCDIVLVNNSNFCRIVNSTVSDIIALQSAKLADFTHVFSRMSCYRFTLDHLCEFMHNLYVAEICKYLFVAYSVCMSSFTFKQDPPEDATCSKNSELNSRYGRSTSFKVIETVSGLLL